MVLVFILLGIIILLLLLFSIFLLSVLQIEIKNLKIGNKNIINKSRIKDNYEIKITLYFLKKIPILCFKLNNKKLRKIYNRKQLENINFKEIKKQVSFNKEIFYIIKYIKITKINLRIDIGIEDAILTSYIIAFLASAIGIILPHVAEEGKISKCHYIINPIYQNRNEYYISLNSIISVKIVHIIYSMLIFIKKGRKKYE